MSPALMQWYHDKCPCPLAFENCHTVHSSSKQSQITHFLFSSTSSGMSGATSLFHRYLSSWKRSLQMVGFMPLFPHGTLWIGHHNLTAPTMVIWAESFLFIRVNSSKHRTEFLQIEHINKVGFINKVTSPHSAASGQVVGCWPKVKHLPPLNQ